MLSDNLATDSVDAYCMTRVLLVDLQMKDLPPLEGAFQDAAEVTAVEDFPRARAEILRNPPDLLITNLRLGAYNGIHLALLADLSRTRCVVYANYHDFGLAREVQAAGAFYIRLEHLPLVLPAFLQLRVPLRDGRDPAVLDRRKFFRSGRRSTDLPILHVERLFVRPPDR